MSESCAISREIVEHLVQTGGDAPWPAEWEEHARVCPTCKVLREESARLTEVLRCIYARREAIPAMLRAEVMARIRAERRRRALVWPATVAVAAALTVMAGLQFPLTLAVEPKTHAAAPSLPAEWMQWPVVEWRSQSELPDLLARARVRYRETAESMVSASLMPVTLAVESAESARYAGPDS